MAVLPSNRLKRLAGEPKPAPESCFEQTFTGVHRWTAVVHEERAVRPCVRPFQTSQTSGAAFINNWEQTAYYLLE
jgi:hypothetical protein